MSLLGRKKGALNFLSALEEIFKVWWPRLASNIDAIPPEGKVPSPRGFAEILEEVLSNTREQLRREEVRLRSSKDRDEQFQRMMDLMVRAGGSVANLKRQAEERTALKDHPASQESPRG